MTAASFNSGLLRGAWAQLQLQLLARVHWLVLLQLRMACRIFFITATSRWNPQLHGLRRGAALPGLILAFLPQEQSVLHGRRVLALVRKHPVAGYRWLDIIFTLRTFSNMKCPLFVTALHVR